MNFIIKSMNLKIKLNIIKDGVLLFVVVLIVCKSCVVDFVVVGDE